MDFSAFSSPLREGYKDVVKISALKRAKIRHECSDPSLKRRFLMLKPEGEMHEAALFY
jgi:hypothetical protein